MTTTLERLRTEDKYDPKILPPNVYNDLFHKVEVLCPCGNTASVQDGALTIHNPKSEWTIDGKRHPLIPDAFATGVPWSGCRYTGRTVTLAAALARDEAPTEAEARIARATWDRLEAGITDTGPTGCELPKPLASLVAFAEAHGWTVRQAWRPERDRETREWLAGEYNVSVQVSRPADEGPGWRYDLSYYVAPGVAKRTRGGLCRTPDRRGVYDTPSLKKIRDAITANPVGPGVAA